MQREFVAQTFGRLPPEKLVAFEELLILTRDLVRAQSSEADPTEGERAEAGPSLITATA
jgi:hypothetical protein